jgi:hypothetical protein
MREPLTSDSIESGLSRQPGNITPATRYFTELWYWYEVVTDNPSQNSPGRPNTSILSQRWNNPGPKALSGRTCDRGPAELRFGSLRTQRASTRREHFSLEVRDRLASIVLILLVLVATLDSPILRLSAPGSKCSERTLCGLALPTTHSPRLSAAVWIERESAVVTLRSEGDEEEDDDKPWSVTRQAYDSCHPALSTSDSVPDWNLAVTSLLSTLHPLRC